MYTRLMTTRVNEERKRRQRKGGARVNWEMRERGRGKGDKEIKREKENREIEREQGNTDEKGKR